MNYKDYQQARNAAWRILIDCGIDRLPVNPNDICRRLGCRVQTYETGARAIQAARLSGLAKTADGFTLMYKGTPFIFYRTDVPIGRQRFTVAHELGHVVLGHLGDGMVSTRNREPEPGDPEAEQQANVFAARLLAPACVLHALRALTPEKISALCGLSEQAARFRAARMQELEARRKFLTHPLEREVLEQFRGFIRRQAEAR